MTAAFWSRFKRFLLSRSYANAAGVCGGDCRLRGRGSLRLNKILGARWVDLDPGAHGRGEHDGADVLALGRGRLGADQLLDDGLVVVEQVLVREGRLADRHVHDRRAVGAVLDLAGLGLLDGLADVHRDRADLRVRHLALWAEDAAEAADDRHHVRRRDRHVEVREALLHAGGEVLGADDVRARLLGLARLVALGEHGDLDLLAEAVGQRDRAAQLLVGVADVQARADVHLDGLVELGPLDVLHQADRLVRGVLAVAVHLLARGDVGLAMTGHYATTSTPMERAVPAMILAAWSTSWALRSPSFFSAIARTCSLVIVPTFTRLGSPEPLSMPMA